MGPCLLKFGLIPKKYMQMCKLQREKNFRRRKAFLFKKSHKFFYEMEAFPTTTEMKRLFN
jgi:hypothetical protein